MPRHRLPAWLAVSGAVLVGVLTATQARINGSLGLAFGDGLVAALVSFGSGLVVLVVLAVVLPDGRGGLARLWRGVRRGVWEGAGRRTGQGARDAGRAAARGTGRDAGRSIPIWMLLGGMAGALTVATQGLTVATIGVALFTVGVVAGQTVNGLVLDRTGYGPAGVVAVTMGRVAGAALVLLAVVLCTAGEGLTSVPWWMRLLPFLAGAGIAWQQATNGRLRHAVESPLVATLVNFAVGSLVLGAATAVHVVVDGPPPRVPTDPWLYLGGVIGAVYIFLSAALVRHTGVLLLGLGSVVGLLATSVVLDAVWPPLSGPSLGAALAAVLVALAGVAVAVIPWGSLRRRTRG